MIKVAFPYNDKLVVATVKYSATIQEGKILVQFDEPPLPPEINQQIILFKRPVKNEWFTTEEYEIRYTDFFRNLQMTLKDISLNNQNTDNKKN